MIVPPLVLDASALLAIAKGEPGDENVLGIIRQSTGNIFIHAVNAFEVAYKLMMWGFSEDAAWELCNVSGAVKIDDAGDFVGRRAARIKLSAPYLSLGDCFCLALAEDMQGRVLTSDKAFAKVQSIAEIILLR
jgi:PIN domain nuclease of toxin-antitoxin system